MNLESMVRYFARSTYYQRLYSESKDFGLQVMFENEKNLSGIQLYFLYWLKIYSSIYDDLANKESIYLDEDVIKDDIRTDAYLYRRRINIERDLVKARNDKEANRFKTRSGKTPDEMHQIDFRR